MYARIAFFEGGGPETMEAGRKLLEEKFLPEMKKLQGFAGHLQLADRENRKAASIIPEQRTRPVMRCSFACSPRNVTRIRSAGYRQRMRLLSCLGRNETHVTAPRQ